MSEMPPEVERVMQAVVELEREIVWLQFGLGNYVSNNTPTKNQHDAMRKLARDVKAASSNVVTATEGVITLGKKSEKEHRHG